MKTIVANWKMNKNISEALDFAREINKESFKDREIIICPPFTALNSLRNSLDKKFKLGAQDVFYELSGAFTGEISPTMLKDAGCEFVIVGHSERRQYFNETDEIVNKKVKAAISNGLAVIMCVGEKLEQRKSGETFRHIEKQVVNGLAGLHAKDFQGLMIAYEPIWAIGTRLNATPSQAEEVHAFIRKILREKFNSDVKILYGGSVNPSNSKDLLREKNVDGLLVGGASLDARKFAEIVRS